MRNMHIYYPTKTGMGLKALQLIILLHNFDNWASFYSAIYKLYIKVILQKKILLCLLISFNNQFTKFKIPIIIKFLQYSRWWPV